MSESKPLPVPAKDGSVESALYWRSCFLRVHAKGADPSGLLGSSFQSGMTTNISACCGSTVFVDGVVKGYGLPDVPLPIATLDELVELAEAGKLNIGADFSKEHYERYAKLHYIRYPSAYPHYATYRDWLRYVLRVYELKNTKKFQVFLGTVDRKVCTDMVYDSGVPTDGITLDDPESGQVHFVWRTDDISEPEVARKGKR